MNPKNNMVMTMTKIWNGHLGCVRLLVRSGPVPKAFVYWYGRDRTDMWVVIVYSGTGPF
jgi:hypothetical protein